MTDSIDFARFDRRNYRTGDARTGYGEWAATYEETVAGKMDSDLLDALRMVAWADVKSAADLACGTGRSAAWLRGRSTAAIDGVDLTPEMLAQARGKGVYRSLREADVAATGLETEAYDLALAGLVDEHLAQLRPLYAEVFRLVRPGGAFVLVGFHPHFIMASGMPTHYDNAAGEPVAVQTHVHLLSEHVTAALDVGWRLAELREQLIDEAWLEAKPKWGELVGQPIAFAAVWRR